MPINCQDLNCGRVLIPFGPFIPAFHYSIIPGWGLPFDEEGFLSW
jgi:hypothetical protein